MANLRRATPADAAELTRLRGLMLAAVGHGVSGPEWAAATEAAFARRLGETDRFAAYVVERQGRLLSGGVGWVEEHLPSPTSLDGRRGHVASMSTDPAARREGHAARVLDALLAWFAEVGVRRIDLGATDAGRPLYASRGFGEPPWPVLSRISRPSR